MSTASKEKLLSALRKWKPEEELTVKVKFVRKGTDKPLTGHHYTVRLYDKETFGDDDYIGHAKLDENGEAHIHFFPSDLKLEEFPDLYILLFQRNTVHFQTKVWDHVDFEKLALLDMKEGEVLNFGTFLVD